MRVVAKTFHWSGSITRTNTASTATRPARSTTSSSSSARSAGSRPRSSPSDSRSVTNTRSDDPTLRSFLLYLASERGLADNSLHAYRRDLEDAGDYLSKHGKTISKAAADDFRAYLRSQSRKGQSTKTIARRV